MCRSISDQPMLRDTFKRLGLTDGDRYQCPGCGQWETLTYHALLNWLRCGCGWEGDMFSVVSTALNVDRTTAIRLVVMIYELEQSR